MLASSTAAPVLRDLARTKEAAAVPPERAEPAATRPTAPALAGTFCPQLTDEEAAGC
jgi:hypothetical protein